MGDLDSDRVVERMKHDKKAVKAKINQTEVREDKFKRAKNTKKNKNKTEKKIKEAMKAKKAKKRPKVKVESSRVIGAQIEGARVEDQVGNWHLHKLLDLNFLNKFSVAK